VRVGREVGNTSQAFSTVRHWPRVSGKEARGWGGFLSGTNTLYSPHGGKVPSSSLGFGPSLSAHLVQGQGNPGLSALPHLLRGPHLPAARTWARRTLFWSRGK
jgi:hypothetical protein